MAVAVATGIIVAVAIALGYAKYAGAWVVAMAFIAAAFVRPVFALVVCFCAIALVPFGSRLFGFGVPNLDNAMGPVLLAGVVLQGYTRRLHRTFRIGALDGLIIGMAIAGVVGMLVTPGIVLWKYYTKNILCPLCFYFVGRFIELSRRDFQMLFKVQLVVATACAIFIICKDLPGRSLIYGPNVLYQPGNWGAMGHNAAATFLCFWTPLFIAASGRAGSRLRSVLWCAACVVVMIALLKTKERAMIAGSVLGLAAALLTTKSWKPAVPVLSLAFVVMVPGFVITGTSATYDRFTTDKVNTRIAYNAGAMNVLRSRDWNPVFGIGFNRFSYGGYAHEYTPPELIEMARGTSRERLLERGWGFRPYIHNLALTLIVEFGLLGTVLFVALALGLTWRWARCLRRASERIAPDSPLLFGLAGAFVAVLFSGMYHNLYVIFPALVPMWFFAGLIMGHPELFREPAARASET